MMRARIRTILAGLALFTGVAGGVLAQNDQPSSASSSDSGLPEEGRVGSQVDDVEATTVPRKTFTEEEVQAYCREYGGRLIGYYGDVYKVEDCERRLIPTNKAVYKLMREGRKIQDVDGDVVAAIPEGRSYNPYSEKGEVRGCRKLEGEYVTRSSVDVYFVDDCKLRLFPDWESYLQHREERGDKKGEILELTATEFQRLEKGQKIPSAVDDMYERLRLGTPDVDIIPLSEACKGVDNEVVSYYSKLYRIENCHKREVLSPERYFHEKGQDRRSEVPQLTSQQWLSLPDGKPVDNRPKNPQDLQN